MLGMPEVRGFWKVQTKQTWAGYAVYRRLRPVHIDVVVVVVVVVVEPCGD